MIMRDKVADFTFHTNFYLMVHFTLLLSLNNNLYSVKFASFISYL